MVNRIDPKNSHKPPQFILLRQRYKNWWFLDRIKKFCSKRLFNESDRNI